MCALHLTAGIFTECYHNTNENRRHISIWQNQLEMKAIGTFAFLFKAYRLFLNTPNAKSHIHEVRTPVNMSRSAVPQKCLRNLHTRKKVWPQFSASTYFCNIWLAINSVRNILRGDNDSCSQWAELWCGILKADSNDLTTLNSQISLISMHPVKISPNCNCSSHIGIWPWHQDGCHLAQSPIILHGKQHSRLFFSFLFPILPSNKMPCSFLLPINSVQT